MLTVAKLRRLWADCRYRAIVRLVCERRPEARLDLDARCGGPVPAAALMLLRLAELGQANTPFARELRDRLLWERRGDGVWGDDPIGLAWTALALRALHEAQGRIVNFTHDPGRVGADDATAVGIGRLASLQAPGGGWGEAFTTGFLLSQLARVPGFAEAVDIEAAMTCRPAAGVVEADAATRLVWQQVLQRVGPARRATMPLASGMPLLQVA